MQRLTIIMLTTLALGLAAGCGSDTTAPSPAPGDVTIVKGASALTTTAFNPNPDALTLGSSGTVSVRWLNADGGSDGYGGGTAVTHQIASDNGAFATSAPLAVGASYSIVLTQSGTYHYHCAIHPTMVGTITVSP